MKFETFKPTTHKLKALIYWGAKKGKTTLASTAPNPLWLCSENGLLSVANKSPKFRRINTLDDLKEVYKELRDEKTEFDTIIIDSLSEISKVIKDNLTDRWKTKMTLQLWWSYSEEIMQTIRQIVQLDYHIIVIVHSKDQTDDNWNVVFYDIAVDGSAKNEIPRYFDTIGYCYIDKDWNYQINIAWNNKTICWDRSNKIPKENTPLDIWERIKSIWTIEKWVKPVQQIKKSEPAVDLDELNVSAWTIDIKDNTLKTWEALHGTPKENLEQKAMDRQINKFIICFLLFRRKNIYFVYL